MDINAKNKALLQPLRRALYNYEPDNVRAQLNEIFSADAVVQLSCPFETLNGAEGFYQSAYVGLQQAIPDLERRETIVIAGSPDNGSHWVGCAGYYTGTFVKPWLDIPPTGHQVSLRFHEFYRIEDEKVIEVQALWDIPEVMLQAGAWPMAPALGREWHVPGPATQDGIVHRQRSAKNTDDSIRLVLDMLAGLGEFANGGVDAMRLQDYWHPRFSWYGPSGIGTGRGIAGFRNWHQIPFLNPSVA